MESTLVHHSISVRQTMTIADGVHKCIPIGEENAVSCECPLLDSRFGSEGSNVPFRDVS